MGDGATALRRQASPHLIFRVAGECASRKSLVTQYSFGVFLAQGGAVPYLVRGAPYLGGREQRRVLTHSAERPKEPLMYTVGYYNDEDFRAFYSGQDAANIDDFFTDNGEYLMVYLPEVTDREFLAGLRYGNGCDALCQSGYALDEAEEALRDMYALAV